MKSEEAKIPSRSPSSVKVVSVMLKGWQAIQEVDGLKASIWKTFFVNYAIFIGIMIVLNGVLYLYVLCPLVETIFGSDEGGAALIGTLLLWGVQLVIAAIFALAALRFSIALMSMWHDHLASMVIRHFRPLPEVSFSITDWLKTLKQTLVISFKEIIVVLLLILLSFLLGIGIVLVFLGGAYLMGRDIIAPYLNVLQEHKEPVKETRKSLRGTAFMLGSSQMVLALIPVAGWLLMPLVMIYQIIGLSYVLEEVRR